MSTGIHLNLAAHLSNKPGPPHYRTAPWRAAGPAAGTLAASALGGLLFVLIFGWAYSGIEDYLYQVRDDGVITMSHARNLVEYGFIGVNPSGGRVEGYSAPVQLFLYAAAYAATGIGYAAYAQAQTLVATFLLGALLVLFFPERKILAVALAGLAAAILVWLRPFLLWHGSGMENAITHVLVMAALLSMVLLVRKPGWAHGHWLAIPIFLASISRVEGIWHIGPLLGVFGGFWWAAFRNWRGVHISLLVLGLWALFQGWRYMYFGDLLPNPAYAQDISILDNLRPWLMLDWGHMYRAAVGTEHLLASHGGYLLLLSLPALLVIPPPRRARETVLLALLLTSLVLTGAFNEAVFGYAWLDRARTTTHLAVVSALGVVTLLHGMLRYRRTWRAVPVLVMAGFLVLVMKPLETGHLCCDTLWMDELRQKFARIANAEDLPRATISNGDLGVMSWHKQFNVVDLGALGSPLIAKLRAPFRSDYFFHYAAPDIVQTKSWFSCHWDAEIFSDPRFDQLYKPLEVQESDWNGEGCQANRQYLRGIWIRRDILQSSGSAERRLIDRLKADLSATWLRDELGHCQDTTSGLYDCAYVARTAYRFLPELRRQGERDRIEDLFAASRTVSFDMYLITGYRDGQAHRAFMDFIAGLQPAQNG